MRNKSGFTLIEVIIVMGVIGIMSAIAFPMVSNWLPNYRLRGEARNLYSNMQRIKLEAVRRNSDVGISFTTVAFPAVGGRYQAFIDDGSGVGGVAGNLIQDGTEATLFQIPMSASCSLVIASFSGNSAVGFNSRGLPSRNWFGSAVMRNDRSKWYRISLGIAGSTRIESSSDGMNWN